MISTLSGQGPWRLTNKTKKYWIGNKRLLTYQFICTLFTLFIYLFIYMWLFLIYSSSYTFQILIRSRSVTLSELRPFSLLCSPVGPTSLHRWGFEITLRDTTFGTNPPEKCSAQRTGLYLTTHNTHNRHIHALCWIRNRNPSKRVAADPRLRPRSHRDRPESHYC